MGTVDYSQEILKRGQPQTEETPQVPPSQFDYSKEILGDAGPGDQWIGSTPLNSVLTDPKPQDDPASFFTQFKTGFADSPKSQMKTYSAARFPNEPEEQRLKRYGVHNGNIVYKDDDGWTRRETPKGFWQAAKTIVAQTPAHGMSMTLGALGLMINPFVGAAGAAVGEGYRQAVGALIFDDVQTPIARSLKMGMAGIADLFGYITGRIGMSGINAALRRKTGDIAKAAGRSAERIDVPETKRMQDLGKKFKVSLSAPETTESIELMNRWKLMRDLPETADQVYKYKRNQMDEVDTAIYKWINELYKNPSMSPYQAAQKIKKIAAETISAPENARRRASKLLYDKAVTQYDASGKTVNIKPVIDLIDDELKLSKENIRTHLLKAKNYLMSPDLPKMTESKILLPSGKPRPVKKSYGTSMKGLQHAKEAIDDEIGKAARAGADNAVRNYMKIKTSLLEAMEKASPEYRNARLTYAKLSKLSESRRESFLSFLADMSDLDYESAARQIFTGKSPEFVKSMRDAITTYDKSGKTWNQAIGAYIQDAYEKFAKDTDTINWGARLARRVFKTPRQRQILKAAMTPKQYKNFKDFMEVLRRTGLTVGGESRTAPAERSLKQLEKKAESGILRALEDPVATKIGYTETIGKIPRKLNDLLVEKNWSDLMDIMMSDQAAKELGKLRQIQPGTRKFWARLAAVLSIRATNEGVRRIDKSQRPDIQIGE